jgi:hypothetical protein
MMIESAQIKDGRGAEGEQGEASPRSCSGRWITATARPMTGGPSRAFTASDMAPFTIGYRLRV